MKLTPAVRLAVLALTAALLLAACGGSDDGADGGKVRVVTTLPLFAGFVREVGGDRVDVSALLPSGADPHTFEPAPRDVQRVAEADLVFANGLGLEAAALKIIEANVDEDSIVLLGETSGLTGVEGGDPHLWMDPANGREYAGAVRDALKRADPVGAATYEGGHEQFVKEIEGAEAYVREEIASIPEGSRKLVTTHDAFGYFARAFGLEVVAFVAAGPGQEASPADVGDLARAIEREGVPAVFTEPQIGSEGKVLQQAAADAGVQVCSLYSDSLDDRVTSYVELLRFNADELSRCLGGGEASSLRSFLRYLRMSGKAGGDGA